MLYPIQCGKRNTKRLELFLCYSWQLQFPACSSFSFFFQRQFDWELYSKHSVCFRPSCDTTMSIWRSDGLDSNSMSSITQTSTGFDSLYIVMPIRVWWANYYHVRQWQTDVLDWNWCDNWHSGCSYRCSVQIRKCIILQKRFVIQENFLHISCGGRAQIQVLHMNLVSLNFQEIYTGKTTQLHNY